MEIGADNTKLIIELMGWLAGITGAMAGFPQIIKIIKTKEVNDLSIYTFIAFFISVFLWGIYGFYIQAYPMMFFNTVSMVLYVVIMYMILKYKKS